MSDARQYPGAAERDPMRQEQGSCPASGVDTELVPEAEVAPR